MKRVLPFQAVRYNLRKINKLEKVVAPPYDCINSVQQNALYKGSPYNCVRLILRKGSFSRKATSSFYADIARDFKKWLSQGILIQDDKPGYYLYRQDYSVNGRRFARTGLFARLELSSYGKKILPHEKTLEGPKKDRTRLLRTARANFSAIFGLYSDPQRAMSRLVRPTLKEKPIMSVRGQDGVYNRVWIINQPERARKISRLLGAKRFWIADGHHRFETALGFSQWARKQKLKIASSHILACLVAMEDPGCQILAIHRLLKMSQRSERERLMQDLKKRFLVKEVKGLDSLMHKLERPRTSNGIGIYDGTRYYFVDAGKKRAGRLDVEFLDKEIITPLTRRLNLRKGHEIQFEHSPKRVRDRVKKKEVHLGILMAPTHLSDMKRLTASGKRMPEKSTYFYPKILSGLIINKL